MTRLANSSRPTVPVLRGLCNNISGTKQKSFHALIWPNSSFANLARCLSRNATVKPSRNLPRSQLGAGFQHGNTSQQLLLKVHCVQLSPPLRHGMGFGGAAAAGEPPSGTLDCLPTCNTTATKLDSNKTTLASSTHARLSNASCARTPMWFPGSVAWNPSHRNHSVNCSRHVIPHDRKTCRNANHPVRAASCGCVCPSWKWSG